MNNLERRNELLAKIDALIDEWEAYVSETSSPSMLDESQKARRLASDLFYARAHFNDRLISPQSINLKLKSSPRHRLVNRDEWNFCPVCSALGALHCDSVSRLINCRACEAKFW